MSAPARRIAALVPTETSGRAYSLVHDAGCSKPFIGVSMMYFSKGPKRATGWTAPASLPKKGVGTGLKSPPLADASLTMSYDFLI